MQHLYHHAKRRLLALADKLCICQPQKTSCEAVAWHRSRCVVEQDGVIDLAYAETGLPTDICRGSWPGSTLIVCSTLFSPLCPGSE